MTDAPLKDDGVFEPALLVCHVDRDILGVDEIDGYALSLCGVYDGFLFPADEIVEQRERRRGYRLLSPVFFFGLCYSDREESAGRILGELVRGPAFLAGNDLTLYGVRGYGEIGVAF